MDRRLLTEPESGVALDRHHGRRVVALMNSYTQGMSGGDAYFIEIAKRLTNVEVVVVTSRLGAEACTARGLEPTFWITTREKSFRHTIGTYLLRTLKAVWLTRRVREDDVIYATSDFLPDVLPAVCCKLRIAKIAWVQRVYHVIPRERMVPHYAQRYSFAFVRHFADTVLADSQLLRRVLVRRGFPRERLDVAYLGIDRASFETGEATPDPDFDAVFLGRLHVTKGIFDLIRIWRIVCDSRPDALLGIIGHGAPDVTRALRREIVSNRLGKNVRLLGFMQTREAIPVLRRSRVFVAPSHEEGFGMAVLEGISAGLPVVAWDLPAYREVFPGAVAAVALGDIVAYAQRVLALLENKETGAKFAAVRPSIVAMYDWGALARREDSRLHEVILRGTVGAT